VGRGELPPGSLIANADASNFNTTVLRKGPSGEIEMEILTLRDLPGYLPVHQLTVSEPFADVVEMDGFGVQCRFGEPCVPPTCEMCWGDPMPRPEKGTALSGHWERITAGSDGESGDATVSLDGSKVAFRSTATDLTAAPDTPNTMDVFLHDRDTGITTQVTDSSDGTAWNTWVQDVNDDGDVLYTRDLDGSRRLLSGGPGASAIEVLPACPGQDLHVARWDAANSVLASCETDLDTSSIAAGGRTAMWLIHPGQTPVLNWKSFVHRIIGGWLTGGVQAVSPSGRRVRLGDTSMGFNREIPNPVSNVSTVDHTEPLPSSGVGDFSWVSNGGAADNEMRGVTKILAEVTAPGGTPQFVTSYATLEGDTAADWDRMLYTRALQMEVSPGGALLSAAELSESTNDIIVEGGDDFWEYANVHNTLGGSFEDPFGGPPRETSGYYDYSRADLGAGNVTSMSYHAEVVAAHTAHSPVGGDANGAGMDVFVWVRD
jgi:hypothetical protein